MKKLINILNSLTILSSSTLAVACNKLKSLYDSDIQKKPVSKNFNDNEENTDNETNTNELEQIIEELKKLKKIDADTIANGKVTVADLISELNKSEKIKSITKANEFSIELKENQNDLLKENAYIFTIIFDEEHKVELIAEVYTYDKNLADLDEAKRYELISTQISEYLKTFDIKADGENKFIDLKNNVSDDIKKMVKPYNMKSSEISIEITNTYFEDNEDILFINEEDEIFEVEVTLNFTDPNYKTIFDKMTSPISSNNEKDEQAVKEKAVLSKVKGIRSKINSKINSEFIQDDEPIFNVVSDDNDTYQDLLDEIKQRMAVVIASDEIKVDNISFKDTDKTNFKDANTLSKKIESNQPLIISYELVYNNFLYELDSDKYEEINDVTNKTFELKIDVIDDLKTKVEKVIKNSSFDKLFFDKNLTTDTQDDEVIAKAENYLYKVSKEIVAMKDKYKFTLNFKRDDVDKGRFDHQFYNGIPSYKLKITFGKTTGEQFELPQDFYLKIYEEDNKDLSTASASLPTEKTNEPEQFNSFGIREKIENIIKTDEIIAKIQANGVNTFQDYSNLVKEILNKNEEVNQQFIIKDVQFINPTYNEQNKDESDDKIITNNKRMLIANNYKKEKYSLLIKISEKIKDSKKGDEEIKLYFINLVDIKGIYDLTVVQSLENKRIKTKIKNTIDKVINNLIAKEGEDNYQMLVKELFDKFTDKFKKINLKIKQEENIQIYFNDEENLTSKISKTDPIRFKVDFDYTNKYGEHIDKWTFDNNEIKNLNGSESKEKIKKEFIEELKLKLLELEQLHSDSPIYKMIYTRANKDYKIEQLINEFNKKFVNILQKLKTKNVNLFGFMVKLADNNENLTIDSTVTNTPINFTLNVYDTNEKNVKDSTVISDLPFKMKIREQNETEKNEEKAHKIANVLKTATLDFEPFLQQKMDEYKENYSTWEMLLNDLEKTYTLKNEIIKFIDKNSGSKIFDDIKSFINEFEFTFKPWVQDGTILKNNYVENEGKRKLKFWIKSLKKDHLEPVKVEVETLLGEFSEKNVYDNIAKDIYLELKKHTSLGSIDLLGLTSQDPKDRKDSTKKDESVYFDYDKLKEKIINKFIKAKMRSFLEQKTKQYNLKDNDIRFVISFGETGVQLKHEDFDLVRYTMSLYLTLNIEVKSSTFNGLDKEFKVFIDHDARKGYDDAQAGIIEFEKAKLEKIKEVVLNILTKKNEYENYTLKNEYYEINGQKIAYEYNKFYTMQHVQNYFNLLIENLKKQLVENKNETLENWRINLDDYDISLEFPENTSMFKDMFELSHVNLIVKLKKAVSDMKEEDKETKEEIEYTPGNNEGYIKHNEVWSGIELFKSYFNEMTKEDYNGVKKPWQIIYDPNFFNTDSSNLKYVNMVNNIKDIKTRLGYDETKVKFFVKTAGTKYNYEIKDDGYMTFPNLETNNLEITMQIIVNGKQFEDDKIISKNKSSFFETNALLLIFNYEKYDRDEKKFDEFDNYTIQAILYDIFENINESFLNVSNDKYVNHNRKDPVFKLWSTAYDFLLSDARPGPIGFIPPGDMWRMHELMEAIEHKSEFKDDTLYINVINDISDLFNFFPALRNIKFSVMQADKKGGDPYIYDYNNRSCTKGSPWGFNYFGTSSEQTALLNDGDIKITFTAKTAGKDIEIVESIDIHSVSMEDIEKNAFFPFLILWELSNNWYKLKK